MTKKLLFNPEQYRERGILAKWHDRTLDQFKGDQDALLNIRNYLKNALEARTRGTGLFIYGSYGAGKTMLLNCLLKELMTLRYSVRVITLGTLVTNFTGTWYDDNKRNEFLKLIQTVDFLAIDDLGKEFKGKSDLGLRVFDNIVRYRLQSNMPILFTANITPKEISENYSEAVASMLQEMCAMIKVSGEDWRKKFTNDNKKLIS